MTRQQADALQLIRGDVYGSVEGIDEHCYDLEQELEKLPDGAEKEQLQMEIEELQDASSQAQEVIECLDRATVAFIDEQMADSYKETADEN